MLGDLVAEETGKITGFRVLESSAPKVEISGHTKGKILGIDYQGRITYTSGMQPGGFLYGEGHGLYMTPDGDIASWKGSGTGHIKPGGGASYRGSIFFQVATGKLAKLAGTAAVFEHESDANENITSKSWAWK